MSKKQTPLTWITDRKTAVPGVYQTRDGHGRDLGFQRWDGQVWYTWSRDPATARASEHRASSDTQSDPWVYPPYSIDPVRFAIDCTPLTQQKTVL